MSRRTDTELRAEFEAAIIAEIERVGSASFQRAKIIKRFMGRGVGRSALYAWSQDALDSGRVGQAVTRELKVKIEEQRFDPAEEVERTLPKVVTLEEIAGTGGQFKLIEHLQYCIRTSMQIVEYARGEAGGRIRNARLMAQGSENLRRSLETVVKVHDSMLQMSRVDQFHCAMLEEIGKESPEVASRIVSRLSQLALSWGAAA